MGNKKKKAELYKVEDEKLVRHKYCPKCGPGVFMAVHEKRAHCGKCGYTEFNERKIAK
ncbi:MAG: 30S ribosomal protein S27ae [Candidatus Diapherotrites archaeon]